MHFIPYSRQSISEEDIASVVEALRSDFLTQGPRIDRFEAAVAELTGARHAIAVSNATAALHIACLAIGLGPGDILWTVPNTFVASANCARYCGATVDFVDIDAETRNISLVELEEKLERASHRGNLPKIIVPVDFAGLPCFLPEISALARKFGVAVIEDASHALGASINDKQIGSDWADITVLSFHAVKIITSAEGGMCLTNDDHLAATLRLLRTHGITRDPALMVNPSDGSFYYEQVMLGYNYRITDIQAALGHSQLSRLPERQIRREQLSQRYDKLLAMHPVKLPARLPGYVSAHHLYIIEILDTSVERAALFDYMRQNSIGVNVHYIPVHLQPDYQKLGFARGDFLASERYYDRAITIPLFPEMSDAEQDYVVDVLVAGLQGI